MSFQVCSVVGQKRDMAVGATGYHSDHQPSAAHASHVLTTQGEFTNLKLRFAYFDWYARFRTHSVKEKRANFSLRVNIDQNPIAFTTRFPAVSAHCRQTN